MNRTDDLNKWKRAVELAMQELIDSSEMPKRLRDAMAYSLEAGGKRIRPALVYAVLETYGMSLERGREVAASLEMVHTYSLIHDDLPAMDDDDLRRGRPTNHRQFDEATAILAGDALLTDAFRILTQMPLSALDIVEIIRIFGLAAGSSGMVGGQLDDMLAEKRNDVTLEELQSIHERKTGALLVYALEAGAILAGASVEDRMHLKQFGRHLGIAFQIQDDILDVVGDEETIGKRVGSDELNDKTTYPKLLGLEGAKQALDQEVEAAQAAIESLSVPAPLLLEMLSFVVKRNH
ncbi:Polyprenyl synthetase [Exiguobacterium sp. AT1b]|jgi:geranylgeranyl diphosphate synthase type II|uniref:Farnesyl diphosphate synthase n=1 Tax=Exiguobacterium sp. (strain ATCC BAA-1283 / AT1b) TaxID=360911 RepID=C4L3F3_EXISA|nr:MULTISPECIES: farnesyl diphosphate synthase [unclassified Exiguobacterium]ACQ69451.1 Polyprenyl synthetase [Exiguobacterium sp. AT1b]